ncbi:uncharacterized protein LOC113272788 [Papaver somniferum]|uniref:uncharacterized protein LOC113272788 n=1 Tax=Papaver somniferum TaxID=3469 RepID=UPI000E6F59B3|nr:uncharacterized protein LOC113272788 [Papaver somniferum]
MQALDDISDDRILTDEEDDMLVTVKVEFEKAHRRKEIFIRQKYRVNAIRDGDRNTKHFHRLLRRNRARNNINNLRINGIWSGNKDEIKEDIANHFEAAFKEVSNHKPRINNMCLKSIDENARVWLERTFSEEKVKKAIHDLGVHRAPGPDGFLMKFYIVGWEFIKDDLMKVFKDFHDNNILDTSLKNNFMALIPKKIDGVLIANECVDSRLSQKLPGLVCKLDFEKAFDNVNWNFLNEVLFKMGFGGVWRAGIRNFLSYSKFSVLVNGTTHGFFGSEKGIRQGDPFSPFLFTIVGEV